MDKIINEIHFILAKNHIETEFCSPNLVASYCNQYTDYSFSSDLIVEISDTYSYENMTQAYSDILKELKKGNAVLIYAENENSFERVRVVTPIGCEYFSHKDVFSESCFMSNIIETTPEDIIKNMMRYDLICHIKIIEFSII